VVNLLITRFIPTTEPPVPIKQETGWLTELVRTFRYREKPALRYYH